MKRISFLIASMTLSFTSLATPSGISIPSGYKIKESNNGAVLMINPNTNYNLIYVDLDKAKLELGNIEKSVKQTNQWHTEYIKKDQDTFYNEFTTNKTFGFINGQFFNADKWYRSAISFALKANGKVYQDKNDKDGSRERIVYSLLQKSGKYYLKFGYNTNDLNNYSDLFVAWHRYEKSSINDGTSVDNRTYMGTIPKNSNCNAEVATCELKAILFLVAKSKTISQSINELNKFGVKYGNMARLDGGGSSQYKTDNNSFFDWEGRNMPHMIEILDK
jgi:hypothetical protein